MTDRYIAYVIKVPGKFADAVAYLDIETRKVPCRYEFPSGEKLSRRWSAFIGGVAYNGFIKIIESAGNEQEFLAGLRSAVGKADTVIYRATRQFDEMVLKGRFTYARRGPADVPFYPAMAGADALTWDVRRHLGPIDGLRERELDSRYVSVTYERTPGLVLVHNLRDVVELILAYGEPDPEADEWGRRVLTDLDYADAVLFGPHGI